MGAPEDEDDYVVPSSPSRTQKPKKRRSKRRSSCCQDSTQLCDEETVPGSPQTSTQRARTPRERLTQRRRIARSDPVATTPEVTRSSRKSAPGTGLITPGTVDSLLSEDLDFLVNFKTPTQVHDGNQAPLQQPKRIRVEENASLQEKENAVELEFSARRVDVTRTSQDEAGYGTGQFAMMLNRVRRPGSETVSWTYISILQDADVKPSGSLLYQMLKPKEERPPTPAKTPPSGPVPQPISLLMRILTPSSVKSENKADKDKSSNKDNTSSNGPSPTAITGGKVHQNGKAPVCPLCGVKVTDTSLDEHLKRHPNGRPYQCDTCVRGFSSKVALINHLASSHATACPTCGLSFTQKDNLARHMATANHFPRIGSLPSHVPPLMEAPPAAARVDPIALLSRVAAQADMAAALAAVSAPLNLSIKSERSGHTPPPAVPLVLNKATIKEPEGRNETVQCRWCDEILERWCDFRGHLKRKHNMKNLPASGRDSKAMREMIRTHGNSQLDSVPPSRNPSRASSASPHLAALINRAPVVKRPWPSPAATPSPKQSRSSSPAAAAGPSRPKIHKPDFEKMIEQMQSRILPSAANPLETADAINGAPAISDAERSVSFEEMVSEIMNQQSRQSTASSADFDDEDENSRASESLVVEPDPEALIKYEVNSDTESGEEEMEDESTMDSLHQMPLLLKAPIGCAAAPPTPPVVTAPAAARKQPPPLIKINMCQPDVKPNIVSPPVSNGTPPEGPGSQRRIGLAGEETGPQPSIEQVYQKWAIEADGVAPVEPTFPPNRRRSRNTAASSCSNGAPKGRQCDSGSEEPVQRRDDSTPGPSSSHHNRISCQLCDKRVFSSQEELGCHVASTHPNHYFCVNCSQVVDGHLDALEEHMASCFKQKLARRLEEMAARASGD